MAYPKFDTKNATEDFSNLVDEMTTAAQLKPEKAIVPALLPPSSLASTSVSTVSVTLVENYLGPLGSMFLIDDPPLEYSKMRGWSEYEIRQFDAAQALFPSAGEYTACGSSYCAYDFIQEAVGILSAKYTNAQKMAICDGIGRHYEHFLVDLEAPAPFQWKHVKDNASLKDKVSQFLKVFAKVAREQTRTTYPLDIKKNIHNAAKNLLQSYAQSPKMQSTTMQFSSSPTVTPSPDAWKFSSPLSSTVENPFSSSSPPSIGGLSGGPDHWSLVTSSSISTFAPIEDTESQPLQSFSSAFGADHASHGNIWEKLSKSQSTEDNADIVNAQAQSDSFEDRTEADLNRRSEAPQNSYIRNAASQPNHDELMPKMQELRDLELNLELIESCCAEEDALLGRMVLAPDSITPTAPQNTLFNAEIINLTPPQLSKHLDTRIKQLKLNIDSAQLLLDQKCTRLALLESGADSSSHNQNAHAVAQEVMELRVQKLEGQIRHTEAYRTLMGQSDGHISALSDEANLEPGLPIRGKPSEQILDNIFQSICSERPVHWTSDTHATSDPENCIGSTPKNPAHDTGTESNIHELQADQTECSLNQGNVHQDASDLTNGHGELNDAIPEDLGEKSPESKETVQLNVEVDGTDQETGESAMANSDDENTATDKFELGNHDSHSDADEDENMSPVSSALKAMYAMSDAELSSAENLNTPMNQVLPKTLEPQTLKRKSKVQDLAELFGKLKD